MRVWSHVRLWLKSTSRGAKKNQDESQGCRFAVVRVGVGGDVDVWIFEVVEGGRF